MNVAKCTPSGSTIPSTLLITPSFSAVSMPCKMTSTLRVSPAVLCAYSRSCSRASRGARWAVASAASDLDCGPIGAASVSIDATQPLRPGPRMPGSAPARHPRPGLWTSAAWPWLTLSQHPQVGVTGDPCGCSAGGRTSPPGHRSRDIRCLDNAAWITPTTAVRWQSLLFGLNPRSPPR